MHTILRGASPDSANGIFLSQMAVIVRRSRELPHKRSRVAARDFEPCNMLQQARDIRISETFCGA